MTDLVPVTAGALDAHEDPVGLVLAWTEQAALALRETHDLDDAKHVLAAVSTLEHATKARDLNATAIVAASAMRLRAERRMGQLIAEAREAGELASRGRPHLRPVPPAESNLSEGKVSSDPPPTLADHGLGYKEAAEYSRLAAVPDDEFDAAIEDEAADATAKKGTGVTRSGVLRRVNPEAEKRPEERWLEADRWFELCRKVVAGAESVATSIRFGHYPGEDVPANASTGHLQETIDALTAVKKEWDR